MKLLFFSRFGNLGGVATQILAREQYLGKQDDVESLYCFGTDHGLSASWPDSIPAKFGVSTHGFTRIARRYSPDLIVSIDSPAIIRSAKQVVGETRVVTEVHTTVESGLVYLNNPDSRTNHYIVPSGYSRRILGAYPHISADAIHVVPNIVSARFHEAIDMPLPSPKRPILLWVGKLDEHKNWKLALQIASSCRDQDFELWLVGGETAREQKVMDLVRASSDLGVQDKLRWIERIDHEHMPIAYQLAARSGGAHLVTSSDESFGMTVGEAIAAKCPVIAPKVGALPELAMADGQPSFYEPGSRQEAALLVRRHFAEGGSKDTELENAADTTMLRHGAMEAGAAYHDVLRHLLENS